MATRNPFGNLTIRRDEDDEDTTTRAQAVPATTGTLFSATQAGEQKKKKKVRPDEKKKLDEVQKDDEEGFEVVKKKGPTKPRAAVGEEETTEKGQEKPKKFKKFSHGVIKENEFNTEKRLYERHSGTGRGKEISKGGAGGKHTWGNNPKNIARDQDYNRDEQFFNSALNPDAQPRRQREERPEAVVEKVEAVVEKVVEKVEDKPAEEKPVEETSAEVDYKNLRKKKKGGEEVKQEELLERPENALSLTEYLEQLKLKNQAISQPKRAEVVAHHANSDLQANAQNDNADEIGIAAAAKKQRKNKEKKADTTLSFVAQTEASTTEKKFEQKGNKRSHGNGAKIHFNDAEFPEL